MGCASSVSVEESVAKADDPVRLLSNVLGPLETMPLGPASLSQQASPTSSNPHVAEIFEWSDFCVGVTRGGTPVLPGTTRSFGCLGRFRPRVKKRATNESFVFGDLEMELEDRLEDKLIAEYRCGKMQAEFRITGGFRFPDFGIRVECSRQLRRYNMYNLLGHPSRVKCMALAPNERCFASCAHDDSAVSLYDVHSGQELVAYFGHEDAVLNASLSADGKHLATCSRDRTMILWDITTGKQLFTFEHDKVVICCAFSHDCRFLVSGCQDSVCRVWDVKKRREAVAFLQHDGLIVALVTCPNEFTVASAATDKTIWLWNGTTGQCLRALRGHLGLILACSWHSEGTMLVSTEEAVFKLWDARSGQCMRTVDVCATPTSPGLPRSLAWSLVAFGPGHFRDYLIAVSNDRNLHVLDLDTGQEVLTVDTRAPVYCLSAGPVRTLAFGDAFGNVYVMELT
eukprot:GGOE01014196.1.p1 GENE.GGOE01014196.1~~GGOE01014196.1.p1  ORF type:complete len:455 (+),score=80.28 GGOE01014196.1:66-1430(+)